MAKIHIDKWVKAGVVGTFLCAIFAGWAVYRVEFPKTRPVPVAASIGHDNGSSNKTTDGVGNPDAMTRLWPFVIPFVLSSGMLLTAVIIAFRRPLTEQKSNIGSSDRPVFVFKHRDGSERAFDSVRTLCRDNSWSTQYAETDLPEHRDGIWVKGPNDAIRWALAEALLNSGMRPQFDKTPCPQPEIIIGENADAELKTANIEVLNANNKAYEKTIDELKRQWNEDREHLAKHRDAANVRDGMLTATKGQLSEANVEIADLKDNIRRLAQRSEKSQQAEIALKDCQSNLESIRNQLMLRTIEIEGLKTERGRDKLYDLGCKTQIIPFSWRVQIKYFDLNDTELAEQIRKLFQETSWTNEVIRSEEHVPRVAPELPRIILTPLNEVNRETAIQIIKIVGDAGFVKEPGGLVLGGKTLVEPVDFCIEIFPRRNN